MCILVSQRGVSVCLHLCSAESSSYPLPANWIGCAEYEGGAGFIWFDRCLYFQLWSWCQICNGRVGVSFDIQISKKILSENNWKGRLAGFASALCIAATWHCFVVQTVLTFKVHLQPIWFSLLLRGVLDKNAYLPIAISANPKQHWNLWLPREDLKKIKKEML